MNSELVDDEKLSSQWKVLVRKRNKTESLDEMASVALVYKDDEK